MDGFIICQRSPNLVFLECMKARFCDSFSFLVSLRLRTTPISAQAWAKETIVDLLFVILYELP
jgi:hypothetical protein